MGQLLLFVSIGGEQVAVLHGSTHLGLIQLELQGVSFLKGQVQPFLQFSRFVLYILQLYREPRLALLSSLFKIGQLLAYLRQQLFLIGQLLHCIIPLPFMLANFLGYVLQLVSILLLYRRHPRSVLAPELFEFLLMSVLDLVQLQADLFLLLIGLAVLRAELPLVLLQLIYYVLQLLLLQTKKLDVCLISRAALLLVSACFLLLLDGPLA